MGWEGCYILCGMNRDRLVLAEIAKLSKEVHELGLLFRRILYHLTHHTASAEIRFGGFMANPGTQAVGSTLTATFVPLEADGTTVTPGATLSTPPAYTIDNTTVATLVDNGDGTATITGVSAGSVTVTGTGGVFTDQDGTATPPLTAQNTDTVTAATGRTVSAQINFS